MAPRQTRLRALTSNVSGDVHSGHFIQHMGAEGGKREKGKRRYTEGRVRRERYEKGFRAKGTTARRATREGLEGQKALPNKEGHERTRVRGKRCYREEGHERKVRGKRRYREEGHEKGSAVKVLKKSAFPDQRCLARDASLAFSLLVLFFFSSSSSLLAASA